jgi:hypothetical protein
VLVGAGVPLAILLAHLTGGSKRAALDEPALRAELLALDPNAELDELLLCPQGQTALLTLKDGRMGVAWAMERFLGLRLVSTWQLQETEEGLEVDLSDPAWPRRRLDVLSPETRQHWLHLRGQRDAA